CTPVALCSDSLGVSGLTRVNVPCSSHSRSTSLCQPVARRAVGANREPAIWPFVDVERCMVSGPVIHGYLAMANDGLTAWQATPVGQFSQGVDIPCHKISMVTNSQPPRDIRVAQRLGGMLRHASQNLVNRQAEQGA